MDFRLMERVQDYGGAKELPLVELERVKVRGWG